MKVFYIFLIGAAASCLVLVTGCATQKEIMLKKGYPLSYAEGFDDGCHSGNKAGGSLFDQFKKDINRFESDHQYAQGWSDGFRQCESEQEALDRKVRMSIEQQELSEQRKNNKLQKKYHLENKALKGIDTESLKYLK